MKKLFYILAAVATLSMTSCSDLLDEVNYGNPTVEDMMSTEENAVLMFGQCYADLKWVHDHWGYWGVSSLTADECLNPIRMPGEHWADGGYWRRLNTHKWNPFADAFKNIWNTTISGAVNCNQMIKTFADYKKSANIKEETYNAFVGELEVLRTYYFYLLYECFGRIPYIEEYVENAEPLMEPELVWSYLVSCLERNAENLPEAKGTEYYGRVTRGFAYGLLARLYLNAESYGCDATNVFPEDIFVKEIPVLAENATKEEKEANAKLRLLPARWNGSKSFYDCAVECCDKVIESNIYSIESDYFDNFKINNENSKENMFVIVEDGRANFDNRSNGSMSNKLRINLLTLHYSHQSSYNMIEKPWNGFCARPKFMELFDENDVRGAGHEYTGSGENKQYAGTKATKRWGWFVGPMYDAKGNLLADENGAKDAVRIEVKSLDAANWFDGARNSKYEVDKTGTYAYGENDFVLMRYADILWMKKEAIMRGGADTGLKGNEAKDFETLKKRAFAYGDKDGNAYTFEQAYGEITLDNILDERGREFAWELVRRRDLIRFGKFNDKTYVQYIEGTQDYLNWFPIPYSVLEKSPEINGQDIWTQNEGY